MSIIFPHLENGPCFVADEWQAWKFRNLLVFLRFPYTVVSSVLSAFLLIRQSRKGSALFSFSLSTVGLIVSLVLLMCTFGPYCIFNAKLNPLFLVDSNTSRRN